MSQLCSPHLATLLHAAGIPKRSLFYWVKNRLRDPWTYTLLLYEHDHYAYRYVVSAFTASELAWMLPRMGVVPGGADARAELLLVLTQRGLSTPSPQPA